MAKLVAGLQEDLQEIVESLRRGRDLARALEVDAKGVNGLSAFLKSKGNELDNIVSGLEDEAKAVERKMLVQSTTDPIKVTVNEGLKAKVLDRKARDELAGKLSVDPGEVDA